MSRAPDQNSNPGGSAGNLCIANPLGRLDEPWQVKNSGPNGTVSLSTELGEWSIGAQPIGGGLVPALAGETWYYQFWHRDVSVWATSNFSEGLRVDFRATRRAGRLALRAAYRPSANCSVTSRRPSGIERMKAVTAVARSRASGP